MGSQKLPTALEVGEYTIELAQGLADMAWRAELDDLARLLILAVAEADRVVEVRRHSNPTMQ